MTEQSQPQHATSRIGVDIGGTFTDVAAVDAAGRLHIGKRLTTHGAEHEGVIQAVRDTGVDANAPSSILAHGTTLVINALLERKGARVGFVTTKGFKDLLDIGYGNRTDVYKLRVHRAPSLVPVEMRFEVDERTFGDGTIGSAPSENDLTELVAELREANVEAIAVGFLNAYLNPQNEEAVAAYLRQELPSVTVTTSSMLSRQWREFERFTTSAANAYVAPVADRYLTRLVDELGGDGFQGTFVVLDSSGGAMSLDLARQQPVRAVESGPVGGVIAARELAVSLSIENLVTFDMGGTTSKSALVEKGESATTDLYWIGGEKHGFPLQVSTVDIIETAVGGGSIASLHETGGLQVGPHSAGSRPGPVCYGLGGTKPTLTDANLYCGRIDKDHFAGNFSLDVEGSRRAIEAFAQEIGMAPDRLALGIIRLANLQVSSTVRRQTLERGNDPRDYTLLASGGAGPLHVCEVAREVGIQRVLIPRFPGHYSALGMLSANLRRERRQIVSGKLTSLNAAELAEMIADTARDLSSDLKGAGDEPEGAIGLRYSLAVRFTGQDHSLWIPSPDTGIDVPSDAGQYFQKAFDAEYVRRYGHLDDLSTREMVALEVVAERLLSPVTINYEEPAIEGRSESESLWGDGERLKTPIIPRGSLVPGDRLNGPAVLFEIGSTTAIPPGASAEVLENGAILIDVMAGH